MKLGFVSPILDFMSFEEVIDCASLLGYQCVELACWPSSKAERRYAGVSHIDVDTLGDEKIKYILDYCNSRNVAISSLAFYPNTLDPDSNKRAEHIAHLKKLILASKRMGVNLVTTFIGRDQNKSIEENLDLFAQVWPSLIAFAEENQVRIGIENCPMLFTIDQWPGGQNLATSPSIWRKLFDRIPSPYFGLNYDPSHFIWQQMDYIAPIEEFKDRIFHVHCKDIHVYQHKLNEVGIMAYPLEYMAPKLPGHGDVNWAAFASALNDIGYDGFVCVEVEDRAFETSPERAVDSLVLSKRYLEQYFIQR